MSEAGRPPLFNSPEEMQAKIDEYFQPVQVEFNPDHFSGAYMAGTLPPLPKSNNVTITGLALYLGFESRQSFYDYEKKPEYSYIIKRARLRVENGYETALLNHKNPTGPIFALKNMGWTDKQEIDQKTEHSGGITIKFEEPDLQHPEDKGGD